MYSAFGIKKKIASNKAVNSFALLTGTPGFAVRPKAWALGGESSLMNIHAFVKNTHHLDLFIGEKVVKHYVALERILAKVWLNVVAGISQFGRIGQHSESLVQSFQVLPALCASPAFFGKTGDSTQIILGSMGKRKCTH
jgi:hypothetical protein